MSETAPPLCPARKTLLRLGCALLVLAVFACASPALSKQSRFFGVKQRLAAQGLDPRIVDQVLSRASFDLSAATGYFRHDEYKLDYGQFSTPASVEAARRYMNAYRKTLEEARTRYGVDPGTVVAVLLVETRLGLYVGDRPVLSTLATLASFEDKENIETLYQAVSRRADRHEVRSWAERKSRWALVQLKALISFAQKQGIDPAALPGSYAGAMGFCQFLPESALVYAADGDCDGKVDLFDHADAIHSVARYLSKNGWELGMDEDGMRRVLYTYNRSRPYADAILAVREKLLEEAR
ncbi:MAG: lytic murein transglycosylase [Deltaproteobacteria bacterium]|nr:lytic murein transglycosylase [Deltaproteobacteria bacterium]